MSNTLLQLIFISLGCAFVANVITKQNGPLFIFSAFRMKVSVWVNTYMLAIGEEINGSNNGEITAARKSWLLKKVQAFKSIGELVVCPYCLGPWLVLLVSITLFGIDSLLQNWLAGSGLLYIWLGLINGRA